MGGPHPGYIKLKSRGGGERTSPGDFVVQVTRIAKHCLRRPARRALWRERVSLRSRRWDDMIRVEREAEFSQVAGAEGPGKGCRRYQSGGSQQGWGRVQGASQGPQGRAAGVASALPAKCPQKLGSSCREAQCLCSLRRYAWLTHACSCVRNRHVCTQHGLEISELEGL